MKFLALLLFLSFSFAQYMPISVLDNLNLRSIWEAPKLQKTVAHLETRFKRKNQTNSRQFSRIIDGTKAKLGDFPYHVLIEVDETFWCGGSILSATWVITVKEFQETHTN
jgi:hypothetical protein